MRLTPFCNSVAESYAAWLAIPARSCAATQAARADSGHAAPPVMPPTTIGEDDSAIGVMCTDVFGAGWKSFRIVAAGGRQRMPVREYFPGEKPYRMVYMEDPFGNILEIYSHSYELTYAAGAYQPPSQS